MSMYNFLSATPAQRQAGGGRGHVRRIEIIYEFVRTLSLFCTGGCLQKGDRLGRTDLCCVLGAADLQEPPQPSREKAPSLIQAAKCSEELHRKGISVLVLHKNIPKIPPCLLPGLWAVVTRGGVWDARQLWGLPSLGGGRITAQPRGDRVCQGGHSVSREGMWQEVTRAGMCHDVAESSSCPGAGLGLGERRSSDTRDVPRSPLPAPRGAVWALPFPGSSQVLQGTSAR